MQLTVQQARGATGLISREVFTRHVGRALASYHDPVFLQTSALVELLRLQPPRGESTASALRQLLRDAIEELRPAASIPVTSPEGLGYRILLLRYMQSRGQYAICQELGLSRTAYYRYHQKALQACAGVLWEQLERENSQAHLEVMTTVAVPAHQQAAAQAIRVARRSQRQAVDLGEVLTGVLHMAASLAEQQEITLRVDVPPTLPITYGDPAMLRQIVLNVLMEGMRLAATRILHLTVVVEGQETAWQLRGLDQTKAPGRAFGNVAGLAVSSALVGEYGGRFWTSGDDAGACTLWFTLPAGNPRTILVIDDDEDTATLYARYLHSKEYAMFVARSSSEVRTLLAQHKPDLILLDVLMPGEDGWAILQWLKTLPETARIPVAICSVLEQPDLALALGAASVLKKPITRTTLLETVHSLLHQGDNAA
mgnify:CR=1 FL=1